MPGLRDGSRWLRSRPAALPGRFAYDGQMTTAYQPVPLEFTRLPPAVQLERSRTFLAALLQRRSVRQFSDEPVPEELIVNAVRAAASAPSGANQQPWTFVVVKDPAVKAAIRAAAEEEERAFYQTAPADWLGALAPLGTDAVKTHLTDAPYLIVVFAQQSGQGPGGATDKVKHYYVRESVGIAAGMLLSSLTLAGLVTLTHTPSPMGFLAQVLGRPPNERAELVIPVGYPAADATVPLHALEKKPLEQVLVWR